MPNSFSLTRKSNMDAGPVSLQQIDNEMCADFGLVPDPNNSYHLWVNIIGLTLATGQSFNDIMAPALRAQRHVGKAQLG